jgi:lauroyl/myristoyl acyltransferase
VTGTASATNGPDAGSDAGSVTVASRNPRGTPFQRARVRAVAAGAWLIGRLPEGPLLRLADMAGGLAYRAGGQRRAQARRNLARVAEFAAERGVGSDAVRAAATDPAALDELVRAAFRNHARYWVELIRAPRVTRRYLLDRLLVETPEAVKAAFEAPGPAIYIGLHLGAIEATAFFLAHFGGRPVIAPMETVADPELQRWFTATRSAVGVRLVGLLESRRELTAGLRSGSVVAIVGDRDLTGGGVSIELFGHPAPLPAGPALLVLETGARAYVAAVRRAGLGRYRGRIEPLEMPGEGSRRERLEAFLAGEARRFESLILDAPEQWWAVFYPIWPDLEAPS